MLIRWCLQRELVVLPKSTHRERIEANAQVFDFALADEEMAALDALDRTGGTAEALERKWWCRESICDHQWWKTFAIAEESA